ncbi:hypothetical protein AWW67_13855 [Roseivirga seohaensis]|uniref:SGNH hydrolase-type esterase domain-containing protein n=1 Tax=Roseivirga seohaensis TaxID=1914963 RepID=A0A150XL38_9BACT|nr:hypothetical protein [Roseivirga seohaensis]KYG79449.1 hypothetical protein AWW67_13855 [Roseivirga seohaensis]
MKKKLFKIAFQLVLSLVLFELGLMLASHLGFINLERPLYTFENPQRYWVETDSTFGIWRPAKYVFRHKKECFDVSYETNSIGARDTERSRTSQDKRVVVIGDSFTEGWGVSLKDRFTNRLENSTNLQFLNFGIASVGMTQEYLIYKNKTREFEHDAVLWVIFPANDLVEDDIKFHADYSSDRYRAYWAGSYPNYTLTHGLDSLKQSAYQVQEFSKVKMFLRNFTYTYILLKWIKNNYHSVEPAKFDETKEPGYFTFTEDQWFRVRYNLEKMIEFLGDKKLYITTVPSKLAFDAFLKDDKKPLLVDSLKSLGKQLNFEYFDLLTQTKPINNWANLYYSSTCDNHWNSKGHEWAAKEIQSAFFK